MPAETRSSVYGVRCVRDLGPRPARLELLDATLDFGPVAVADELSAEVLLLNSGDEAAATYHFSTPAADLTREQACALAAILPDPRHRDPSNPSEGARRKEAWIQRQMDFPLPRPE